MPRGVAVDDVTLIPSTRAIRTDSPASPGRVGILIPTCDHIRDLETCVESIYARTTYPDFEILLIENNSKEEQTFRSYERMRKEHPDTLRPLPGRARILYSALNNTGPGTPRASICCCSTTTPRSSPRAGWKRWSCTPSRSVWAAWVPSCSTPMTPSSTLAWALASAACGPPAQMFQPLPSSFTWAARLCARTSGIHRCALLIRKKF